MAVFLAIAALTGITVPARRLRAVLPALLISGLMLGAFRLLISSTVRQLENFAGVMNFVIFPMLFFRRHFIRFWKMAEVRRCCATSAPSIRSPTRRTDTLRALRRTQPDGSRLGRPRASSCSCSPPFGAIIRPAPCSRSKG